MEISTNTHNDWFDIIIPTFDNVNQLSQCVESILAHKHVWPVKLIIVNNGEAPLEQFFNQDEVTILDSSINHVELIHLEDSINLGNYMICYTYL